MVSPTQTKLRQAALNLLSNAAKFTKRGTITLVVRRDQKAGARLDPDRRSTTPASASRRPICRSCSRISARPTAATSRKYGGTGLGLALSQKLCALMGGGITVQSEVGRGSCFTIRVPAVLSAEPVSEAESASSFGLPSVPSPMLTG